MNPATTRFATLMSSVSLLTLANILAAHAQNVAQAQMAQEGPEAVPEQVLITGSLIHGTAAVGVPVTNLGVQDFTETGNTTIGDLFRTIPEANVAPGPSAQNSGGHQERETRVNIRGLDATGPRSLLMIDGVRFPPQADGICAIDPSIIPSLALDRVDILADGASATYGSDAIAGVINVVLKRGFDGATTLLHVGQPTDGGGTQYQASQLWGRTWNGGDITITYEWSDEQPVKNVHSNFTLNYAPWGLEDTFVPVGASIPGVVTVGAPKASGVWFKGGQVVGTNIGTNCTNCWSIPRGTGANFNASLNSGVGPTAPGSASTISWATLISGAQGANNFIDPLSTGWELAAQQKNSSVLTLDQRLFDGVSFFASGFYTNRRVEEHLPSTGGQGLSNYPLTVSVPTTNPYYPAGAPAGLQVSYDFALDIPPSVPAWEYSWRYQFGVNLELPFNWIGQIYDSRSYEDVGTVRHFISKNGLSVALGDTVSIPASQAQSSLSPATMINVTKPANIPYFNVFCDPLDFQCNSPTTINYASATSTLYVHYTIDEKGGRFDGPLFDVPAGQVKAAIGGLYDGDNVVAFGTGNNQNIPGNPPVNQFVTPDPEPYHIWAEFAQLDVPVFGDNFNFPLVRRLDLEGSIRHDDYGGNAFLTGGTTNPKVAFTWVVDELVGATVRGSWGTSFRFANAGEFSNILSGADQSANLPTSSVNVSLACTAATPPPAGTLGASLLAAGFPCGSSPGGISYGGGPQPVMRSYVNPTTGQTVVREGGIALQPEKSQNYSIGAEFAPQFELLRGFDLQTTYYSVKVNNVLAGALNVTSSTWNDPTARYHLIVPSDLGCPVSANANPSICAPFELMVSTALNDTRSDSNIGQLTNVYWLNDSGTTNTGFTHVSGVDWNASYNTDLGDLGAWNTGITGTYYLHRFTQTVAGGAVTDSFNSFTIASVGGVQQLGVPTAPRLIYRARLGWSDGPFNATLFFNWFGHYFATNVGTPPNVNFQCTVSGGAIGGGTFPCAISNYNQHLPPSATFDLSLGYTTGNTPANDYLKNLTVQLTVIDLLDKHAAFLDGASSSTRNPGGYDLLRPNVGRIVGLTLIKNW